MDILIEWDPSLPKHYVLTGKSEEGSEWLEEYATTDMEWWGKSLIPSDIVDAVEHLDRTSLSREYGPMPWETV